MDRSTTIRASVRDVEFTLMLSVLLVVAVVFVFLRSARATLIPSVAVPLSLVATFGGMYLFGYSINNLSLMALTISTGFVVDDAIVVTENVTRFIEAGEPPFAAAIKGAKQIGFTIVSITASLLAVFIPLLLMGGIVGRLFREFAVTLSIAIALSAFISLTLTPMMASRLLRATRDQRHGRAFAASSRFFDSLMHAYDRSLSWVLDHSALMQVVTGAAIVLTIFLYMIVPKGLFPQQDTGSISGISDAPQDISFPAMRDRQELINKVVLSHPAIEHMVSFIGFGTLNTGNAFIQLKPRAQRTQSADQVIGELRPKLAQVPGITLFLQSVQDVRMGGRGTRTQYQYTLQDANLDELNQWAPRMLETLKSLPQLRDVATDQQTQALELDVNIDRDTAARLGITPQDVDNTLYDAFGQRQVSTMFTQLNQYRVVLEVKPEFQQQPDALRSIYVVLAGRCSGAAQRHSALQPVEYAPVGQSPGPVPGRHPLLQPRPERLTRTSAGRRPQRRGRISDCRPAYTPRPRARRRRLSTRCVASPGSCWPRFWPSTSCWGCSTKATCTRSPYCPRCPRLGSVRCWRSCCSGSSSASSLS